MSRESDNEAFALAAQKWLGVRQDGWAGIETMKAFLERTNGTLPKGVVQTDILPEGYFDTLAKIESNHRPYVKAASSSASGLYQFIKSTWIGEGGQWGPNPKEAFGGLKPPVAEQTMRARTFTERNAKALRNAGIPVTKATLYAAHFLGSGTAVKILRARDDIRADQLAGAAATNANPSVLKDKTVGDFKAWLARKTA